MFSDSHCHLELCLGDQLSSHHLAEYAASLAYIMNISTNTSDYLKMCALDKPSQVFLACGLYPEAAPNLDETLWSNWKAALEKHRPAAVGEIGMDYFHDYGTPAQQEDLFRRQLQQAAEWNLPVIIHSREAYADTLRILKDFQRLPAIVMHCFGYGPAEAEELLALGCLISFAGNVTYPKAVPLQEALKIVPVDRLLLETDAPYLTPVPLRGQRNMPAYIEHTYTFAAQLRGTRVDQLAAAVKDNFRAAFRVSL